MIWREFFYLKYLKEKYYKSLIVAGCMRHDGEMSIKQLLNSKDGDYIPIEKYRWFPSGQEMMMV